MFSSSKIIIPDSISKGGIAKTLPDPRHRQVSINQSVISPSPLQKPKEKAVNNNSQTQVQKKVILPLKGGISKTTYWFQLLK